MSGPGKPELSWTQLAAAGLATATTAFCSSYLGVSGTIIGAALMSVLSTAGATFYKHYLDRGRNQLVDRMPTLGTRLQGQETKGADDPAGAFPAHDAQAVTVVGDAGPGADETVVMKAVGSEVTRLDLPVITAPGERPWKMWLMIGASAAAVFAAVLGGIAAVEALTGSRVGGSSLIHGQSTSNNHPGPATTPSDGSSGGHSTPHPDSSQSSSTVPHTTVPTTPATTKPTVPPTTPNPNKSGKPDGGHAGSTQAP